MSSSVQFKATSVMNQISKNVTVGAVWMIGMRLIDRGIGFFSTIILARLLVPEDFGVVAMAMAVLSLIEIGGQFGFDVALIRNWQASRAHYDSAWTLSVGYGLFTALALAILAVPSAAYFHEPRLTPIIFVLAVISFIQSLENIGIIYFRKNFQFNKDFQLSFTKKLISFTVTLVLAYIFRSYWSLLGGIAASRISGVILSYWLHPYRPRFNFSEISGLLIFSRWIVLRGIINYFIERGPVFLIGRFFGASVLGMVNISREISTLPTTELIFPIMRAVFPGYAAIAHDRTRLANSFLMVQGVIVLITVPAGVGIVMLADPIVKLLLGSNWLATIPLIQILGLYGAVTVFQATNISIFNVLGKPYWSALLNAAEVIILLPAMYMLFSIGYGVIEAAWLIFVTHALIVPIGMLLIERLLKVGFKDRFAVTWRPLIATATMALMIELILFLFGSAANASNAALQLVVTIPIGAIVFMLTTLVLWKFVGMPNSPEKKLIFIILDFLNRNSRYK